MEKRSLHLSKHADLENFTLRPQHDNERRDGENKWQETQNLPQPQSQSN